MAVDNIKRAIRPDSQIRGLVKFSRPIATNAWFTEFNQDFSLLIEFENLIAFLAIDYTGIDDPEIVVFVDHNSVGPDKHAGAEAGQDFPVRIEFEYWVDVVVCAGSLVPTAALKDPDIAFRVYVDCITRTHLATIGHLHQVFVHGVVIGVIRKNRVLLCLCRAKARESNYRKS